MANVREENEKKRKKNIEQLIENFNNVHLQRINEGYVPGSIYYLQPITINVEENTFNHKIYSRRQLGEFLYPKLKTILEKRAFQITALKIHTEKSPYQFNRQEIETINRRYSEIRLEYQNLDPEIIRLEYFAGNELF